VQRQLETLAGVLSPLVVLACAVWVGLLALANVRERRTEIGLLRAIGKGSATIASLFLGKAVLVGLLGAVAGFALGTWLAHLLGANALDLATAQVSIRMSVLLYALVGAPLVAAIASYLPTISALTEDPAVALREQ
jgi:putative ABC transport system permease protein